MSRPPVLTNRYCKLVSDQMATRIGSASRRLFRYAGEGRPVSGWYSRNPSFGVRSDRGVARMAHPRLRLQYADAPAACHRVRRRREKGIRPAGFVPYSAVVGVLRTVLGGTV
jgi:hypothetical protein